MIQRLFPLCLLLHGCLPDDLVCWDCPASPPYAGPPPSASTSRVSEDIAWDAIEGHLAWIRDGGVLIADANERTLTRLGFAGYAELSSGAMALSPDATRVALGALLHVTWEYRAFVVPSGGGETRRLDHEGFWGAWGVAWSPDGAGVYVTATPMLGSDGQDDVFFVQSDGSGSEILPLGAWRGSVAVSPDGGRLATGGDGMRVMNADGSAVTRISTPAPGYDEHGPAWSPDGEHIAFFARRDAPPIPILDDGQIQIVVMEPSGSAREVVLRFAPDLAGCEPRLAWSPSGRKLAYNRCVQEDDLGAHLHVLDLDTRESVPVTRGSVVDGAPSWVP
jgi:Tol biopolymer transport system component